MYHAWFLKHRPNIGCAEDSLTSWVERCRPPATPPPGRFGQDTYARFCKVLWAAAQAYKDRPQAELVEELLATIAGMAASCGDLDCGRIPPDLLPWFKGFLECARDTRDPRCP
jgi:hypothetical protein